MDVGDLVYAFFNSAGPGGVLAMAVLIMALVTYFLLTRWIIGDEKPERKTSMADMDGQVEE